MTVRHDGEYAEIDGRPSVRFVRRYPQPIETVWAAITTPEGLAHWFPSPTVVFDPTPPRTGGTIHLSGDEYAPEGSSGSVLTWEPPHRFGFEWGKDELFVTLRALDDGGTELELVDHLEATGGAARNGAGWDFCLAALEHSLTEPSASDHRVAMQGGMDTFLPVLEQYKGKGLPDDGWLPEQHS